MNSQLSGKKSTLRKNSHDQSMSLADFNESDIYELNKEIENMNKTQIDEFLTGKTAEIVDLVKKYVSEIDHKRIEESTQKAKQQLLKKESPKEHTSTLKSETKFDSTGPEFINFLNKFQDYINNVRQLANTKHLEKNDQVKLDILLNQLGNPIANALLKKNWIFVANELINNFMLTYFNIVFEIRELLTKILQLKLSFVCDRTLDDLKKKLKMKINDLESKIWAFPVLFKLEPRTVTIINTPEPEKIIIQTSQIVIDENMLKLQVNNCLFQDFPELQSTFKMKVKSEIKYVNEQTIERPVQNELLNVKADSNENKIIDKAHELFYGFGKPKNPLIAIQLYKDAEKDGSIEASCCLGKIYKEGINTKKDLQKAKIYLEKAAGLGNAEACYQLGKMYEEHLLEGFTKSESIKISVKYLETAADLNHSDALTDLGFIYEKGLSGEILIDKTKNYYKKASSLNNPRAMNNLASFLLAHESDKTNTQKMAFELFEKSSNLSYFPATTNLGICYLRGIHVERDYIAAKQLFKEASDKNDPDAIFYQTYFQLKDMQSHSSEDEYHKIAESLRKVLSITPNHSDALYYLGYLYENGFGVEQDFKSALHFYSRSTEASEGKDGKPIYKTANILFNGSAKGYVNKPKAICLYKKAADLGDCDAAYILGVLYEEGVQVEKNEETARNYYNISAKKGNTDALFNLGLLRLTKLPETRHFNNHFSTNLGNNVEKNSHSTDVTWLNDITPEDLIINAAQKGNKRALNYLQTNQRNQFIPSNTLFSTLKQNENKENALFQTLRTNSEKMTHHEKAFNQKYTGVLQQFMNF